MKHLASTLWLLSALVLLCGCGGGGRTSNPTSGPPAQGPNATGNWQFNMTSAAGMTPGTIAGSITQSGSSVNGAVHVDGSKCFDQLTTTGLTGTLTGNNLSLTSTSVAGQVIKITGNITNDAVTGMYSINGGCANGDQGNVTGVKIPAFSGNWTSGFKIYDELHYGLARVTQDGPSSEGTFGVAGTVDDSSNCLSGTITSGTFPSPSYIMGASVALEIKTADGTVVFLGTMNQDGTEIIGSHQIIGGTCDGFSGAGCFGRSFSNRCRLPPSI